MSENERGSKRRWSVDEIALLKELAGRRVKRGELATIATKLNRSIAAIKARLHKEGVAKEKRRAWTDGEHFRFMDLAHANISSKDMAATLDRSLASIKAHRREFFEQGKTWTPVRKRKRAPHANSRMADNPATDFIRKTDKIRKPIDMSLRKPQEMSPVKKQLIAMLEAGVSTKTIAETLGKTSGAVRRVRYLHKKAQQAAQEEPAQR